MFLLKLISKKLSRKEGKVNTVQHGQGEIIDSGGKHRLRGKKLTQKERIFSPSTPPVKVEQLLHGLRGEK